MTLLCDLQASPSQGLASSSSADGEAGSNSERDPLTAHRSQHDTPLQARDRQDSATTLDILARLRVCHLIYNIVPTACMLHSFVAVNLEQLVKVP